ncbi:YueI family protein [Streptococcus sp. sy010]|uniref:YueI family protein n=1 Tax=Streptococcus sp. sy010 TaxID=2600148 RepID=UPI0011B387FA|nr:YueI family protein [Streptococcus sp. sy010]TWT14777.1 DUF1694 domain-containing protein [Streptococcus sp. sy010]
MENLEQKILEAATAEHRLDPDQQRYFLGTFEERVILALKIDDASKDTVICNFPQILRQISSQHTPISVKISPKLDLKQQMTYLKLSQEQEASATIVNESQAQSPFALIVHTDHAVNLDYNNISDYLPQEPETTQQPTAKKSFFQKIFGK